MYLTCPGKTQGSSRRSLKTSLLDEYLITYLCYMGSLYSLSGNSISTLSFHKDGVTQEAELSSTSRGRWFDPRLTRVVKHLQ